MAYVTIENLCSGMVVARKLLDHNQRVLLPSGIALTEPHIQSLRSLGVKGLEIRSSYQKVSATRSVSFNHSRHTTNNNHIPLSQEQLYSRSTSTVSPPGKPAVETLRVTRATTQPLRPRLEPVIAKQTNAILTELLKGTGIKDDSAVVSVIRLCTIRALLAKNRQKTVVNIT